MSSASILPVARLIGNCPDVTNIAFTQTPCEYGPIACGASLVAIIVFVAIVIPPKSSFKIIY
jgi:hypothetical protein